MQISQLFFFILSSFFIMLTPGPNMLALLSRGIQGGKDIAIITVLGYGIGDLVQTLFAVVGISAIIHSSFLAYTVLRYLGIVYLLYLGLTTMRSKGIILTSENSDKFKLTVLKQSILSSLLNPKTAIFFLAYLPQFVSRENGNIMIQLMTLGLIFTLVGVISYLPLAMVSDRIGIILKRSESISSKMNILSGSLLIMVGLIFAFPDKN